MIEGSLEVKLPTIWMKSRVGRVREEKRRRKKIREEKESEERRCRCAKREKSRDSLRFPMICCSGRSKSRLARAAGAETSGQLRDEKLHAVVARSTFRSQICKALQVRSTFGSWDVEKVHAVVARSTSRSQHVQNTSASDHFQELSCRKMYRRCGAKHMSNSKV